MLLRTLLSLFLLSVGFTSLAQTRLDSLLVALEKDKTDVELVDLHIEISGLTEDHGKKLCHLKQALSIARKGSYDAGIGEALLDLGIHHHNYGNADSSLNFYLEAEPYLIRVGLAEHLGALYNNAALHKRAKGDPRGALALSLKGLKARRRTGDSTLVGHSYMQLSDIYDDLGDLKQSLAYGHEAMRVYEAEDFKAGLINTYNNVAVLYSSLGYKEKHLGYLYKCLSLLFDGDQPRKVGSLYNNLGNAYKEYQMYDSAEFFHKKAIALRTENQWESDLAESHYNLGELFAAQELHDSALRYFRKCALVFDKSGWKVGRQHAYVGLGNSLTELGRYKEALPYLQEAQELAEATGLIRLKATSSEALAKTMAGLGRYPEAYRYHVEASILKDSLLNADNQEVLAEMETKYETAKKDLEITQLEKDRQAKDAILALQAREIESKNFQRSAYAVGLGIAIILVLVVSISLMQKRKDNRVIRSQKSQVEAKNREILDSIKYAKRLQDAILPNMQLVKEYLSDSFVLYKPKDIVAGDFYWMQAEEGRVWFAAADCTGHGVPGAMVSVVCANALNRAFKEDGVRDPGELLTRVRQMVIEFYASGGESVKDGMDIALCELDTESGMVRYAGANNPMWVVCDQEPEVIGDEEIHFQTLIKAKVIHGKKVYDIKGDKQPIGHHTEMSDFATHSIKLSRGDCLYLFSDGYADQFGGDTSLYPFGKKFKYQSMKQLFSSLHDTPMDEQRQVVDRVFMDWKGELEQVDDVCVIGVRV